MRAALLMSLLRLAPLALLATTGCSSPDYSFRVDAADLDATLDGGSDSPITDGTFDGIVAADAGPLPDGSLDLPAFCAQRGGAMFTQAGVPGASGHCYMYLYGPTTAVPWPDAETACTNVRTGGHLATITTSDEMQFLIGFFPVDLVAREPWIGYSAQTFSTNKLSFYWITLELRSFDGWMPGAPDGTGPCVGLRVLDKGWHDQKCSDLRGYLCELDR